MVAQSPWNVSKSKLVLDIRNLIDKEAFKDLRMNKFVNLLLYPWL